MVTKWFVLLSLSLFGERTKVARMEVKRKEQRVIKSTRRRGKERKNKKRAAKETLSLMRRKRRVNGKVIPMEDHIFCMKTEEKKNDLKYMRVFVIMLHWAMMIHTQKHIHTVTLTEDFVCFCTEMHWTCGGARWWKERREREGETKIQVMTNVVVCKSL